MAFAEVLFMVRVRVPLGSACAAFAIILHYFLLTAFTSMNALAMDLFLTFRDALERAKLYQYLLYTWLMPVPIVIVTVIVEFGSSVSVGYGENCWIGNPVANLVAFGVPVFSAILINAVLATFVLLAIRKSFVIADKAKSRSNSSKAWVYLRICFLTGFTWILGFIYPYVNSRAVEYIFIVLNASQGLLLALMLTITSKVVQKWKVAIRERFGLAEPNKDNRATTAAIKQRTTATASETSSSADIPLTTFTDVEENRARIQLDSPNRASGCTATVSNRKTTVCATCTEMPKTTLADVEKTARSHLNKPQQDNGATAAASTKLASTGGTDAVASGSDVVAGGSDEVAGGSDVVAGGSDVVAGGSDEVAGGNDVVAGGSDVVAGGSEVVAGGSDVVAGGSDVVAGGTDVEVGESDALAGENDVVAGGIDVVAGGTDVVAGGTDVVAGGTDEVGSITAPDIDEKETSF
ncbi:adhesion G protein-coupled receptor L2-like [Branchiostoma floridae]|nr:adhesion G protein-coupled receptor L2-like [Branchiostoma floridae]